MIKSMTGFGRGEYSAQGREYAVEIKTVNHRYYDIGVRIPRQYSFLEEIIRKAIPKYISRGKIEVNAIISNFGDEEKKVTFDENLIKMYLAEAESLEQKLGIKNDLTFCRSLNLPDVVNVSGGEDEEKTIKEFNIALEKAIDALKKMRELEGEILKKDIISKSNHLLEVFERIEERSEVVVKEYQEKLTARLEDLLSGTSVTIDENRIAAEIAIFSDRASIDEETVRFKSHVSQLIKTLDNNEAIGKKLDFIVQEMNREINTIGSKANDLDITKAVIELKNEIEKIREQIQNIE